MKKSKFATVQMCFYYLALLMIVLMIIMNIFDIIASGGDMDAIYEINMNRSPINNFIQYGLTIGYCISIIAIIGFAIADIFYCVKQYKNGEFNKLRDGMKKIKLVTIPCYFVNYGICIILCLMLLLTIVASLVGVFMAFLFTVITCLVIAATGAYGISLIKLYNKTNPNQPINKIHCVLQLLPCVDVISTILILKKIK